MIIQYFLQNTLSNDQMVNLKQTYINIFYSTRHNNTVEITVRCCGSQWVQKGANKQVTTDLEKIMLLIHHFN